MSQFLSFQIISWVCDSKYTHHIKLHPGHRPVNVMPYRASPEKRREMSKLLEEQVQQGVLEEVKEPGEWASPAFLVEKAGSRRGEGPPKISGSD